MKEQSHLEKVVAVATLNETSEDELKGSDDVQNDGIEYKEKAL